MSLFSLLNRRILGFRVVEMAATLVLTATVLTVYMAKTGAGDKTDDIDRIQQQIQDERTQIHLLKVEVASEEQPERLAALAGQYLNMAPISPKHEIGAEALADIAQPAETKKPAPATGAAAPGAGVAVPAQHGAAQPLQTAAYAGAPATPADGQAEDR